ncbi:hypothetical protein J3R30DRAFT_3695743 [Lentinula aciculospora]|uniref:Uncharacterized protein n=1 Tax=Lentinula aciculospora TaxID=153920 RepID=A0A9W9ARQ1_9AGAR|nr:hypothetical protein J3R30DRAFT_3695743 [Lentinula aciculospora]
MRPSLEESSSYRPLLLPCYPSHAISVPRIRSAAVAASNLQCSPAVNGTLQLVMLDNPGITRTDASFHGSGYVVDVVEAYVLKIFNSQVSRFRPIRAFLIFIAWEQSYSDSSIYFLYGPTSGCQNRPLRDWMTTVSTRFYGSDCSVLDDESQLCRFFRIEIQPTAVEETDRDPLPSISVPQSSDPDDVGRYSFTYSRYNLADSDPLPTVVATNPRMDDSNLGFSAF